MSFNKDNTWDGYSTKKVFSDENGVFFKDGPKWAAYYYNNLLGYFRLESDAEKAFFREKGITTDKYRKL